MDYNKLANIFHNPRVHTDDGYHRRDDRPLRADAAPHAPPPRAARTVPCVACGKMYGSMSSSVSHFESGGWTLSSGPHALSPES